eukprot:COSAG02_NODE_4114_length_5756_cov_2.289376_3_plen_65_part_00
MDSLFAGVGRTRKRLHDPNYVLRSVVMGLGHGGISAIAVLEQWVPVGVPLDRVRGLGGDRYIIL